MQQEGPSGLVSMEAEHVDENVPGDAHRWANHTASGQTGAGALQAIPNNGRRYHTGFVGSSPRLDYRVAFNRGGIHYLWLRTAADTKKDDTLHAGLDGIALASATGIKVPVVQWGWSNANFQGQRVEIDVPSAGVHTLNLWMREDGLIIDKIVLTSSGSYTPSGVGPGLSSRELTPIAQSQESSDDPETEASEAVVSESPEPTETADVEDTGTATLSWHRPTLREDGTSLDPAEIKRYEISYGPTRDVSESLWVDDVGDTSIVLANLPKGKAHYAAMRVRDNNDVVSEFSNMVEFFAQ